MRHTEVITLSDTPVLQFISPNLQSHIRITGENLQCCLTQYLNRHSVQNASVRVHGVSHDQLPKRPLTILWSFILILTTHDECPKAFQFRAVTENEVEDVDNGFAGILLKQSSWP